MPELPVESDTRRSRMLTILGWVHMIFGVATPIRIALGISQLWNSLGDPKPTMSRSRYVFQEDWEFWHTLLILRVVVTLTLGALGSWAGWNLVKRKARAPLATGVAVGAGMVEVGYALFRANFGEVRFWLSTLPLNSLHIVAFSLINLATDLVMLFVWPSTLAALIHAMRRHEFPQSSPPWTPARVWTAVVLSAVLWALAAMIRYSFWLTQGRYE